MTDADVLVKWAEWISEAARVGEWGDDRHKCIAELAAEICAFREKSRDEEESLLRMFYRVCDELEKAKAQVAELRELTTGQADVLSGYAESASTTTLAPDWL
jgi:hypothetical protein